MKNKVLVIGSGPSLLNHKRGDDIDNFDGKIIRCNKYEIDGFEKYIGTRTDIYICGQLDVIDQFKYQYDYVLLYLARIDGGRGLRKVQNLSPHNKVKFISMLFKDKLRIDMGLKGNPEPTTGMAAINWAIIQNYDVFFCGMDCVPGTEYFHNNDYSTFRDIACHDYEKEKLYIDWSVEKNRIKRFQEV